MASIKQYRGKTWRAIVRRKGFPVQSKTFQTKRDAEQWAAGVEARMGVCEYDPLQLKQATITTCATIFERYLAEVVPNMRGRNESNIIGRLIRDAAFMSIRLDRVRSTDIRDWRDSRAEQVSQASVHRELNSISAVFTHAIKEWSAPLEANPCHAVSRFKGADKARNLRWSDADVMTFLKASGHREDVRPTKPREYVGWALLLAIETAMREAELCLPTVADFHPQQQYVHLEITKNGDERDVPLSRRAIQILAFLCEGRKPEERIIPFKPGTICEHMLDVRRMCGLEHLVLHDARHTAATALSKKLSNVLELSAVTGHRSLKSLKRYYHPSPADLAGKLG